MKRSLRTAIEAGEFIIAPGLHDMIAAVICNRVGFDFVYASGYWTTASAHGLPDAGIATYTQMLDRVATLVRTVNAGVIADADTGYGGLLNVHHTVRGYEEAGVNAIQIEDQEFPKKCGHTPFKRVVPTQDMVDKVKVACAATKLRDLDHCAYRRPPARWFRGRAQTRPSLRGCRRRYCLHRGVGKRRGNASSLRVHQKAHDGKHGRRRQNSDTITKGVGGDRLSACPATTGLAAAHAAEMALSVLKETGTSISPAPSLFPFNEFNSLIGFEDVWAFERKWGRRELDA
jgi:Phosphoenolpyruvate phosphomutase